MARQREVIESQEARTQRLFNLIYKEVEEEITAKHIAKQREPIVIQLKPFFEPTTLPFIFFYDHESKADLKMLTPRLYTEDEWNILINHLWPEGGADFICPSVPVAFAKFTRLKQYNPENPLESEYEYLIDFYAQEELDKLTNAIEDYEIINYAKKADYQNKLLLLKDSNNIAALRQLQESIQY